MATTIKQPQMPLLNLDVQKTTTYVARPFRMTQGDKGYQQPFKLTNAFAKYDVTANSLGASMTKPDGTIVEVSQEPNRWHYENNTWYFDLPEETAQSVGNVTVYFYIQNESGSIVASTTKFGYNVTAKFGDDIPSNNYVSAFERMSDQFQGYLENARTQLNTFNDLNNDAKAQLTASLADLEKQTSDWLNQKETEVNNNLKQKSDALQAAQDQFNQAYNDQVAKFNNEYTAQVAKFGQEYTTQVDKFNTEFSNQTKKFSDKYDAIGSDWDKQSKSIQSDYEAKLSEALKKVEDDKNAKLQEIQTAWNKQTADQKTSGDATLKQLSDKLSSIATEWTSKKASVDSDVQAEIKKLQDGYDKIKADYDAAIEKNRNIDLGQYYTKPEVDTKVAAAGKVKRVAGVEPDSTGNVPIDINYISDYNFDSKQLSGKQKVTVTGANFVTQATLELLSNWVKNGLNGKISINDLTHVDTKDIKSLKEAPNGWIVMQLDSLPDRPTDGGALLLTLRSENDNYIQLMWAMDDEDYFDFYFYSETTGWLALGQERRLYTNITTIVKTLYEKANTSDVYTKSQIDSSFAYADNVYSKTQSDNKYALKSTADSVQSTASDNSNRISSLTSEIADLKNQMMTAHKASSDSDAESYSKAHPNAFVYTEES